jgi:hypothetical protein
MSSTENDFTTHAIVTFITVVALMSLSPYGQGHLNVHPT